MRCGQYFTTGYDFYSIFMNIGMILLVSLLVAFLVNVFKKQNKIVDEPLQIFNTRYANGEITFEEYQKIKALLYK